MEKVKKDNLSDTIVEQTSQCVKCGLCLTVCPTYKIYKNEARSPRGRLSLMQALAKEELLPHNGLKEHLDSCLHCRACESVCPSNVKYGNTIDLTKQLWEETSGKSFSRPPAWVQMTRKYPLIANFMRQAIYLYQKLGINKVFDIDFLRETKLGQLELLLPKLAKPKKITIEAKQSTDVQVFLGCVAQIFDQQTSMDSIKLLQACGFTPSAQSSQSCCGVMDLHLGQPDKYNNCVERNSNVFLKNVPIVYTASGCGPHILGNSKDNVFELCDFLEQSPRDIVFQPLNAKVLVHTPCTLKTDGNRPFAPVELLKKIPGLDIHILTDSQCCGASGTNMVNNPKLANGILETILESAHKIKPDYIVTSNIGCLLHFQKYKKKYDFNVTICHPVSILAKQIL